MLGDNLQALEVLEGALPLVEAGGDLTTLYITLNNAGSAATRLGRVEQCMRYEERALAVTERIGNPGSTSFVLGNLGGSLLYLGDWQGAREYLERGLALSRTMGRSADIANPLMFYGWLQLWEGNWEEARSSLGEALAVAQETADRQHQESAQIFLAELDILEGRPKAAVARLEPLVSQDDRDLSLLFSWLAWAHLALDNATSVERAQELVERAIADLREQTDFLIYALWVQGMVFLRQGHLDEAYQVLCEGLEHCRSMPYPYFEARVLVQLSRVHARREEPEEARARLEEALAIFQRLGARRDVEWTEQALVDAPL
jgi:tetratricopeptide (TPR) repeat protein